MAVYDGIDANKNTTPRKQVVIGAVIYYIVATKSVKSKDCYRALLLETIIMKAYLHKIHNSLFIIF